jgi:protein-tyrosine-phosphatase
MKRILVVCTGNICRSPMAQALLEHELRRAGLDHQIEVLSAGTAALVGESPSAGSILAMAEQGLDITAHRARQLDGHLVRTADLILVMEEAHRRRLFYNWPEVLPKTFLLSEMAGEHEDIADPYGGPQAEYNHTAARLADLIRRGMPTIRQRLGLEPPP